MKRLLSVLVLIAGLAGAQDYVLATKLDPGYFVPQASMPYPLWLDSAIWLTAESPVLNAGTTSAQLLCYAKASCGPFTQSHSVAAQPTTVTNSGVKAWVFGGSQYWITSTNIPALTTNNFTIRARVVPQQGADRNFFGCWDYPNANRQWRVQMQDGVLRLLTTSTGASSPISTSSVDSSLVPTVAFDLEIVRTGTNVAWKINGASVASAGEVVADIYDGMPAALTIGCIGNSTTQTAFYTGEIGYVQIIVE